jgi:hypothetical protein
MAVGLLAVVALVAWSGGWFVCDWVSGVVQVCLLVAFFT